MQQLRNHITQLLVYLLLSITGIEAMELVKHDMPRQVQQKHKNSLRGLFEELAKTNVRMHNFLDDIFNLPITYAKNVIEKTDVEWMRSNRALLANMVKHDHLDMEVASLLVNKLGDPSLARDLAGLDSITSDVASLIIDDFLKTDIKQCLNNFATTYARHFPKEMMSSGNDKVLHKVLVDGIAKDFSYVILVQSNNDLFCKNDFYAQSLMSEEMVNISLMLSYRDNDFLVSSDGKNCLKIMNRTTGSSCVLELVEQVRIGDGILTSHVKIAELSFKNGNIGILSSDGRISRLPIPKFLSGQISLKDLASVVYCKLHALKKYSPIRECLGHTVFESQDNQEERKLIDFIETQLLTRVTDSLLRTILRADCKNLEDAILLRDVFNTVAQKLGITRKQVAINLYANNDKIAWRTFHRSYKDFSTDFMINKFGGTFNKMYACK